MGQQSALTIYVFSFSYKYGGIPQDPSGNGGGFVFDCRGLPNPHWDERLRPHHGGEAPIIEFMEQRPAVAAYHNHCRGLVVESARTYVERGYERLMVAFGCTGGRHRSVYQAEILSNWLQKAGFQVELIHQDRDRPRPDTSVSAETGS